VVSHWILSLSWRLDQGYSLRVNCSAFPAAAAALIYMGREIRRRQKKLQDRFLVLRPDSKVMCEHLEEPARRGVIRPYRSTAPR
jgi:hypothetical protein